MQEYLENNHSVIGIQQAFQRHFNIPHNNSVCNANTIWLWIMCMQKVGKTLRGGTPEHKIIRKCALGKSSNLAVLKPFSSKVFCLDLRFHPYKIMLTQELSVTDYANHRTLSEQMVEHIPPTATYVIRDVPHLHLSRVVNKQNFHYWAENNPQQLL